MISDFSLVLKVQIGSYRRSSIFGWVKKMKVNIIYESKYGNVKKAAEDLMEIVKDSGFEAHIYPLKDTKPGDIGPADFYVFGSPARIWSLNRKMKKAIKDIDFPKNVRFGLITTSEKDGSKIGDKIGKMLEKNGIDRGVKDLNLKVKSRKGPLEKGYKDRIEKFCSEIAA